MRLSAPAIVVAARAHGETGVIARLLTAENGLIAAYVAGGRGRQMRPVLIPGNLVAADISARSDSQLPFAKVELLASRGPFLAEPLPAAAITWATALAATALPERHAYPAIHAALGGLLDAVCGAPSARGWVPGLVAYEGLVLRELGYGNTPRPAPGEWEANLAALDALAPLVERYLLADRRGDVMGARHLLRERLARIG
ncbi:DNA repair protein RecO [Parablastomonas sp. CN1-191]|uniref:DNA repair protein RecO n=1 Tax=Parablastomonas sp. CN1-191 TaxID=3400908 RepID=UPI003BF84414